MRKSQSHPIFLGRKADIQSHPAFGSHSTQSQFQASTSTILCQAASCSPTSRLSALGSLVQRTLLQFKPSYSVSQLNRHSVVHLKCPAATSPARSSRFPYHASPSSRNPSSTPSTVYPLSHPQRPSKPSPSLLIKLNSNLARLPSLKGP